MISARTETSSAETGSSSSSTRGLHRERPRDAHPLALSAGQLVGIAAPRSRRQADHLQQLRDAPRPPGPVAVERVRDEHLVRACRPPSARIERRVRVLEHELDAAPMRAQLLAWRRR